MYLYCIVFLFVCSWCLGGTPDEWKSRTIYQALTDRISPTSGSPPCPNLGNYCGGTFQGLINNLDYILKMGFDAIWISPVITNTPGGYHGYWAQNLLTINSNFGTEKDLFQLVSECHSRGIWVMVDVVANHVGPVGYSYSTIVPFNDASHYHNCNSCPSGCQIQDFNNQPQVEDCRLAGLPDLNQTNSFVSNALLSWITNLTSFYGFDGVRIDTVPEVDVTFWKPFQQAAGVYGVGEVYNGDVNYVASYQGPLDAVLSYPLFFTLRNTFESGQSLYNLQTTLQQYQSAFSDLDLLGTFIDNHDQPRFLNGNHDYKCYQNAITYVLIGQGIPIIYYGTEQGFNGSADPNNREILWASGFSMSNPLFTLIATLIKYRKSAQVWNYPQVQRYADDQFYAFTRGNTFVALTNGGSNQGQITRNITFHPYSNGQKLCNIFYSMDCVTVANGCFEVYLDKGESKVFYPAN
eukprot:Phypoly_transcript_08011.p1 GENE.Phypoly_transcript_08011~~Phypoly_transcript_08011.p1  ORF type:complete len:464 (+),score=43.48 Phypoly_transcript_08011:118-1509(+)